MEQMKLSRQCKPNEAGGAAAEHAVLHMSGNWQLRRRSIRMEDPLPIFHAYRPPAHPGCRASPARGTAGGRGCPAACPA